MRRLLPTALAVAFVLSGAAGAAPLTSEQLLREFNLITFGDLETGHDVEGRSYIGGNLSGGSATFNIRPTPASDYAALVVAGNVSGGSKNVDGGGDASVGGSVQNMNMNGGTLVAGGAKTGLVNGAAHKFDQAGAPGFADRFPTDVEATIKATSAAVRALGGDAPTVIESKKLVFDGSVGTYLLDLALLGAMSEIQLDVAAGEALVINVSGKNGAVKANFLGGPVAAAPYVLWNFFEAETLDLERQFIGSILAPFAHVTNATPIEGTLAAQSAALGGEMHLRPYAGPLPAPVPVPAALPLLASAFAGLVFLGRRRRAA